MGREESGDGKDGVDGLDGMEGGGEDAGVGRDLGGGGVVVHRG